MNTLVIDPVYPLTEILREINPHSIREVEARIDFEIALPGLKARINQLSDEQKEIFYLTFYDGISERQIAQLLHFTRIKVRRIKEKLKELLRD